MRRWERSSAIAALAIMPQLASCQQPLKRIGPSYAMTYTGTLPAAAQLRVNGHGPVTVTGGTSREITYTVTVSVQARSEEAARRMLNQAPVRFSAQGPWAVLTAPGGAVSSNVAIRAPRLTALMITTTSGSVDVKQIDGQVDVKSAAGDLTADHIRGACKLVTGGGSIRVGEVSGPLECGTAGGPISVKNVHGNAVLETQGGDIDTLLAGGSVEAHTGAGEVRIGSAEGPVTATTGGGQIIVEKTKGIVTARNMAGPVQVGAAAGVRSQSGSGGVRISNISGSMNVSTSAGSIFASLLNGRLADSYLGTGNGDITVVIPSNVGVTVQAVNEMADNMARIVSDFRDIQTRRQGTKLIAQGIANGGGPLLRIAGAGGTIYIRRP